MPIYEYACKSCEQTIEKLQKISDAPIVSCPHCGKDSLERLVSAAGFRLKGAGWYETDFKGGSKKNLADDKDSSPSTSNADSSSDTASKTNT